MSLLSSRRAKMGVCVKDQRTYLPQVAGIVLPIGGFRAPKLLLSFFSRDLRTHILRLLGPKTMLYKAILIPRVLWITYCSLLSACPEPTIRA